MRRDRRWAARCLAAMLAAALASPATSADSLCSPGDGEAVVVRAVGDDLGLTLADGRLVRLVGIVPANETGDHAAQIPGARAKLAAWLEGRPVHLRVFGAGPDRWNRWPALAFASAPGDTAKLPLSVAFAVVDAGLSPAGPEPEAHECWAALRAAEDGARVARLGLWADPYYAMRKADDVGLADMAGTFVVVEGRVAHQGETRASVFFDLGPRHRALAVRMTKRMLFSVDQGGLDHSGSGRGGLAQATWVGRRIRVRGVLDDRGGPVIDVLNADQIEVLRGGEGSDAQP